MPMQFLRLLLLHYNKLFASFFKDVLFVIKDKFAVIKDGSTLIEVKIALIGRGLSVDYGTWFFVNRKNVFFSWEEFIVTKE